MDWQKYGLENGKIKTEKNKYYVKKEIEKIIH